MIIYQKFITVMNFCIYLFLGRRGGLMVSPLDYESSGLGSSSDQGFALYLGKILYYRDIDSLHPGVYSETGEFNYRG